ncbi:MAG: hypothetical protein QOE52_5719, partial [Mycobacterium sp.]|nr:hypothetical protein [Mycobacterium sp.]MDT5346535.1 hypothetical protein [Mycobacterium sp.]
CFMRSLPAAKHAAPLRSPGGAGPVSDVSPNACVPRAKSEPTTFDGLGGKGDLEIEASYGLGISAHTVHARGYC